MACLQQTVTTATASTAAAAAAAAQGNPTNSKTSMRLADASDPERDSMEYQDADTPEQGSQRGPRASMQKRSRNPAGDEDGWQTVLTLRQKKALAQGKKLKKNVEESKGDKECKRRLKPQAHPRASIKTRSKNPWKDTPKQPPPGPRWLSSDDSEDEEEEWPSLHREHKTKARGESRSRSRTRTSNPANPKRSKKASRSQSRSRSSTGDEDIDIPRPKPPYPQLNPKPRAPVNKSKNTDHTKAGESVIPRRKLRAAVQQQPIRRRSRRDLSLLVSPRSGSRVGGFRLATRASG
ncbi:serine/arginine repetitive matrix protein 1-like [Dermacentor silvarum]|uniref:serine/arginine repetitive matrix protein 1-like n=1 Tax=Dermacentor silvarum TaxID=543639 RepID=UPI0018998A5D|nr:serine/arginine repetitive matrix protein 1-like [Dermacentor silvarum]